MPNLNCPNCASQDTERTRNLQELCCLDCGTCYQCNELNETRIYVKGDYNKFVESTIKKITENIGDPRLQSAIKNGSLGYINEGRGSLPVLIKHLLDEAEALYDQYNAGFREKEGFVAVMEGINRFISYGCIHEDEYPGFIEEFGEEEELDEKITIYDKPFDAIKGKKDDKKDDEEKEKSDRAKLAGFVGEEDEEDEIEDEIEDEVEDDEEEGNLEPADDDEEEDEVADDAPDSIQGADMPLFGGYEDGEVPPEGADEADIAAAADQIQQAADQITTAAAAIAAPAVDDAAGIEVDLPVVGGPSSLLGVSSVGDEVNGVPTDYGDDYTMVGNPHLPSGETGVEEPEEPEVEEPEGDINDPYGEAEDEFNEQEGDVQSDAKKIVNNYPYESESRMMDRLRNIHPELSDYEIFDIIRDLRTQAGLRESVTNEKFSFKVGDRVYVNNEKKTCTIVAINESKVVVEDQDGNETEIDVAPGDLEEQEAIQFSEEEDPDVIADRIAASEGTIREKWAAMSEEFEEQAESNILGLQNFDEDEDISEYFEEQEEDEFDPYGYKQIDEEVETAEADADGISKNKVYDGMGGGVEDNVEKAAEKKHDKDGNVTKKVETAEKESNGIDYPEDGLGGGVEETKEA